MWERFEGREIQACSEVGGEVGVDGLVTEPLAAPWALGCSFLHQWREALGAQPTPAPGQTGRGGKWPGAISELRDQREKEAGQDSAGGRVPLRGGLGPVPASCPSPARTLLAPGQPGGPSSLSPLPSHQFPRSSQGLTPALPTCPEEQGRGSGGGHTVKSPAPG